MAYNSEITFDRPESREVAPALAATRTWSRQRIFILLFAVGTIIAALGWLAEWAHLADVLPFFRYSVIITVVGHAMQVIGAFGMLLTPDYIEEENE